MNLKINEQRTIERGFYDLLMGYRWTALLHSLIAEENGFIRGVAWDDLINRTTTLPSLKDVDLQTIENYLKQLLIKNQKFIKYSFIDMVKFLVREYSELEEMDDVRMQLYPEAMKEIVDAIHWVSSAFKLPPAGENIIIDIGCGLFPYVELFENANPTAILLYQGYDKRDYKARQKMFNVKFPVNFLKKTIGIDAVALTNPNNKRTLFFGNTLHCFKEPAKVVSLLVRNLKPKVIMILETVDNVGLNSAFDYHMKIHSNTGAVTYSIVSKIAVQQGLSLDVRQASSQHVIYVLEETL